MQKGYVGFVPANRELPQHSDMRTSSFWSYVLTPLALAIVLYPFIAATRALRTMEAGTGQSSSFAAISVTVRPAMSMRPSAYAPGPSFSRTRGRCSVRPQ
jgi:hypothetical protein